jgi:hypothetical protein
MKKTLLRFCIAAIGAFVLAASGAAVAARYIVTPGDGCVYTGNMEFVCDVATGTSFDPLKTTAIEIDLCHSTTSMTPQAEACRQAWTGTTYSCGNYSPVTLVSGCYSPKVDVSPWQLGSTWDYRSVVLWADKTSTQVLGTYVVNSVP